MIIEFGSLRKEGDPAAVGIAVKVRPACLLVP